MSAHLLRSAYPWEKSPDKWDSQVAAAARGIHEHEVRHEGLRVTRWDRLTTAERIAYIVRAEGILVASHGLFDVTGPLTRRFNPGGRAP